MDTAKDVLDRILAGDPDKTGGIFSVASESWSPSLLLDAIYEQAEMLGIEDVEEYGWIAARSVLAELPSGWVQYKDECDRLYYLHESGESRWDHPCDQIYRDLYRSKRADLVEALDEKLATASDAWKLRVLGVLEARGLMAADAELYKTKAEDLSAKLSKALDAGERLRSALQEASGDRDRLRETVGEASSKFRREKAELERKRDAEEEALRRRVDVLAESLKSAEDCKERLKSLETENERLKAEFEETSKRLQIETEELRRQLALRPARPDLLKDQLSEAVQNMRRFKSERDDLEEEVTRLKSKLEEATDARSKTLSNFEARAADARAQLLDTADAIRRLEAEKKELVEKMQMEDARWRKRIEEIQAESERRETRLREEMVAVNAELDDKIAKANEEKSSLLVKVAEVELETALERAASYGGDEDNVKLAEEWRKKYESERASRRELHNTLMNLQGNIRVACRCRPPFDDEGGVIEFGGDGEMAVRNESGTLQRYEFDHVLRPECSQSHVYESVVRPLIQSVVDGYSACVFAYGQTGSGKSHTMLGPANDRGLYHRAVDQIFAQGQKQPIQMSVLEIYNETIRDLLCDEPTKKLEVRGGSVAGLSQHVVESLDEVETLMEKGTGMRTVGGHEMNARSSRSHLVVSFHLAETGSTLRVVDLAGSERLSRTKASGDTLKEGQYINRSLSALGDVIHALGHRHGSQSSRKKHVPYRNSKLTHVLQDSLSRKCKVLMLVTVSPTKKSASETICSLAFATRCHQVKLGGENSY